MIFSRLSVLLVATTAALASAQDDPCMATCVGDLCTFTMKVNLFAGELGYYTFDECGAAENPTLGMEIGKTYRFVQADRSNYYHPVGFAYFPDGAHDDVDELEPVIAPPGSGSACATDASCPAPMYVEAGTYLGTYNNLPPETFPGGGDVQISAGEENFGLDDYEPKFFYPIGDWLGFGTFEVYLRFTEENFSQDIFYFCHIHQFMTGRIKLINSAGSLVSPTDTPELPYEYDTISEFDQECGTFNLTSFQLPNAECPEKFVCEVRQNRPELRAFAQCIDAMNCHMMASMTTHAESEVALFIHQMIPHHQNAVNMAKALMKTGINCDDLAEGESTDCIMERILRSIINGQNHQIQEMRGVLEELGNEEFADCPVKIFGESDLVTPDTSMDDAPVAAPVAAPTSSAASAAWTATAAVAAAAALV